MHFVLFSFLSLPVSSFVTYRTTWNSDSCSLVYISLIRHRALEQLCVYLSALRKNYVYVPF